ncbi:MAG: protein translocase subunit SecD [Candidatus Hatepunaea meridiana]|nr:protein translocase subunit SecD [Candidatus Hatepunaea meridiana]
MKQRKLLPRFIIIVSILIVSIYLLFPTFKFSHLNGKEEKISQQIAEKMGVSYSYVIENLYKDESILRDKLDDLIEISPEDKQIVTDLLGYAQGEMAEGLNKSRKSAIKRGLDLQGGMHLVLEVDLVQLMRNLARTRDQRLEGILTKVQKELDQNPQADFDDVVIQYFEEEKIKLSQYFGEPGESNATVLGYMSKQADDAISRSLEILRNRIDQFGVSEPSIRKQGARRILLELPGVQDPARARDLIGRTAMLEFKLVADPDKHQQLLKDIDKLLVDRKKLEDTTSTSTDAIFDDIEKPETTDITEVAKADSIDEDVLDLSAEMSEDTTVSDTGAVDFSTEEAPFSSLLRGYRGEIAVPSENLRRVKAYLTDPDVEDVFPDGTQVLWSAKPEIAGDGKEYYVFYLVKNTSELTGSALSDARVEISSGYSDPGTAGKPEVSLTLNRAGARKFARVTGANIDKKLAIVLDDKVHMAPVIRAKIAGGRARIEGSANFEEAEDLAIVLRAGALPTSVIIEEERTVGPSLGRDSIRKGTTSAIIGMILVIIFMVIYYGMSGLIANVALLMNILLIFGGLAFFGAMGIGATLSLPGIAGIILTIGMAVDANVLIFERIREELETGKTVWHAISAGYDRAFRTILDANLTTLIAALVLLQFGSGPIKGFAVTLAIGILSSLFTAIVVTRLIFDYITSKKTLERLSI